jgi:hypothetical protein
MAQTRSALQYSMNFVAALPFCSNEIGTSGGFLADALHGLTSAISAAAARGTPAIVFAAESQSPDGAPSPLSGLARTT